MEFGAQIATLLALLPQQITINNGLSSAAQPHSSTAQLWRCSFHASTASTSKGQPNNWGKFAYLISMFASN